MIHVDGTDIHLVAHSPEELASDYTSLQAAFITFCRGKLEMPDEEIEQAAIPLLVQGFKDADNTVMFDEGE